MTRIEPLSGPFEGPVAEDLTRMMPPGMAPIALFRTLAKNPRVLRRFRRGSLLDPGSVSVRDREVMILRTTARTGAEYEWGVHVAFFSGAAGLDARQIRATVFDDPEAWTERDRVVLALADELHRDARPSDATFEALRAHFDEGQVLELLALAGFYRCVAYVVNGAGVPLEDAAPRFPSR